MRKVFAVLVLFSAIICLSFFVSAGYFPNEEEKNVFALNMGKGWNLVYGFASPDQISAGDYFVKGDIRAVYAFIPTEQKYIRMYPNPLLEELKKVQRYSDDELFRTAFWVYSDKEGLMNYRLSRQFNPINETKLYAGWNFFAISPDFIFEDFNTGKLLTDKLNLNSVRGTCSIKSAYWWQPREQKFISVDLSNSDALKYQENIGSGMIIKVSNDCILGSGSSSSVNPPSIPGDDDIKCVDSDGGLNYNVKGTVTGFNADAPVKEVTSVSDSCSSNTLHEWICTNSEEYDDESYNCPNGCSNGACIQ